MKKYLLSLSVLFFLLAPGADAALTNFRTFTAEGAGISIDAVGLETGVEGVIQAEIPAAAVVEAAYLYSAAVAVVPLADVDFQRETQTSDDSSRLDVGSKDANFGSENRWDVTSIVAPILNSQAGAGPVDFSVKENEFLDGEILAVLYSVSGDPIKTAFIFDGELATTGDVFDINLSSSYDGSSEVVFSLGISYGLQNMNDMGQFTQVDVNGSRLTTSAGGQDDGFDYVFGGLITAGGIGDSLDNPINPDAKPDGDPHLDDELYNLSSFMEAGDNQISIATFNESNDDNVFFAALVVDGKASVDTSSDPGSGSDPGPAPVPEPGTLLLLGTGLLGLAARYRSTIGK